MLQENCEPKGNQKRTDIQNLSLTEQLNASKTKLSELLKEALAKRQKVQDHFQLMKKQHKFKRRALKSRMEENADFLFRLKVIFDTNFPEDEMEQEEVDGEVNMKEVLAKSKAIAAAREDARLANELHRQIFSPKKVFDCLSCHSFKFNIKLFCY